MTDATRILSAIERGDSQAAEQLLPLVYAELHQLAVQKMANENPGQTLQATALVHEAYLRLVDSDQVQRWDTRGHFFAAAAEAMRRILIDQARRKQTEKHGGSRQRIELDDLKVADDAHGQDVLALDEALNRLESQYPAHAQLVRLRYFAGLSIEDTARALDISPATAKRRWTFARAWLFREVSGGDDEPPREH